MIGDGTSGRRIDLNVRRRVAQGVRSRAPALMTTVRTTDYLETYSSLTLGDVLRAFGYPGCGSFKDAKLYGVPVTLCGEPVSLVWYG